MSKKEKKLAIKPTTVKGIFGIRLPKNFRYKVQSESEMKEVNWLIKEGVFKNLAEYEDHTTRRLMLK